MSAQAASSSNAAQPTVNAEFVYGKLPREDDLRLLRIDSVSETTLSCHLLSESCVEASQRGYYALSYCWGDEPFSSTTTIDGRPFAVKPNALRALKAVYRWLETSGLLSGKRGCHVWIDAICINQNDNNDKSIQVRRMDQVYTQATHTLIWLGAAADDSDKVTAILSQATYEATKKSQFSLKDRFTRSMKKLTNSHESDHQNQVSKDLETKFSISKSQITSLTDWISTVQYASETEAHYRSLFDLPDPPLPFSRTDPTWQSVALLFSRPWFSRIWTYQEGVLSTDATVLCGAYSVPWRLFRQWRAMLVKWMTRALLAGQIVFSQTTMEAGNYSRRDIGEAFEALQNILVFDVSVRHASVAKDFVYGYLGVVGAEIARMITVDYSIPDWVVFAQAASIVVEGSMGANSWSFMVDRLTAPGRPVMDGLPSWCPNFTHQGVLWVNEYAIGTQLQGRMVRDEVVAQLSVSGSAVVSDDMRTMSIDGYVVDTADQVSAVALRPSPDIHGWEDIWSQGDAAVVSEWLSSLESMVSNASKDGHTTLQYPDCILSFFFEGTDGDFDRSETREYQRPTRFIEMTTLLQKTANITDPNELSARFARILSAMPPLQLAHASTQSPEIDLNDPARVIYELKRFIADLRRARHNNRGRHFFTTTSGRVGFCSHAVEKGQKVCYFSGSYAFKVLSLAEDSPGEDGGQVGHDRFIGLASVDGLMGSELLNICEVEGSKRRFCIG